MPDETPRITAEQTAAIEKRHYEVVWQRCDSDGTPNPEDPLPSFCGACTDEEYVGAIEFGDTIDEGADVVSWPCDLLTLAREVDRLRAVVADQQTRLDAVQAEVDASDPRRVTDRRPYRVLGRQAVIAALAAGSGDAPVAVDQQAVIDRVRQACETRMQYQPNNTLAWLLLDTILPPVAAGSGDGRANV